MSKNTTTRLVASFGPDDRARSEIDAEARITRIARTNDGFKKAVDRIEDTARLMRGGHSATY